MALPSKDLLFVALRAIYRESDPQTSGGRSAYLDALDNKLMAAINNGGKRIKDASSTGSAVSYEWADSLDVDTLAKISNWARGYITSETIEQALDLAAGRVRSFRTHLTSESCYG